MLSTVQADGSGRFLGKGHHPASAVAGAGSLGAAGAGGLAAKTRFTVG